MEMAAGGRTGAAVVAERCGRSTTFILRHVTYTADRRMAHNLLVS